MQNIINALAKVQDEMPALQKDAVNPHFKNTYITLNKLIDIVLPVLKANGILLIQAPTNINGEPAIETILTHIESGESWSSGPMPLMLEKDNPQGLGSAITYARRYSLMSILGLVADEDDDGEKASPKKRNIVNQETPKPNADGIKAEFSGAF